MKYGLIFYKRNSSNVIKVLRIASIDNAPSVQVRSNVLMRLEDVQKQTNKQIQEKRMGIR